MALLADELGPRPEEEVISLRWREVCSIWGLGCGNSATGAQEWSTQLSSRYLRSNRSVKVRLPRHQSQGPASRRVQRSVSFFDLQILERGLEGSVGDEVFRRILGARQTSPVTSGYQPCGIPDHRERDLIPTHGQPGAHDVNAVSGHREWSRSRGQRAFTGDRELLWGSTASSRSYSDCQERMRRLLSACRHRTSVRIRCCHGSTAHAHISGSGQMWSSRAIRGSSSGAV